MELPTERHVSTLQGHLQAIYNDGIRQGTCSGITCRILWFTVQYKNIKCYKVGIKYHYDSITHLGFSVCVACA